MFSSMHCGKCSFGCRAPPPLGYGIFVRRRKDRWRDERDRDLRVLVTAGAARITISGIMGKKIHHPITAGWIDKYVRWVHFPEQAGMDSDIARRKRAPSVSLRSSNEGEALFSTSRSPPTCCSPPGKIA